MIRAVVAGAFDDLRSPDIRFLQEAARTGPVAALLWSDGLTQQLKGQKPRFPQAERKYFLEAIRFVESVTIVGESVGTDQLPRDVPVVEDEGCVWIVPESESTAEKEKFCRSNGLGYEVVTNKQLKGFPYSAAPGSNSARKKVLVTGCYDWLHSGHVRFFEEVGTFGDLYVVVGHDANIRLLKGTGHPLLSQDERRYVVGAVRHVKESLVSTGEGWLDAEPEIERLKPDIYAVNEDGDRGGKREFCEKHGIEYMVLNREPAFGLPKRTSTELRGF
jgi:cytidyltransferase-like protein